MKKAFKEAADEIVSLRQRVAELEVLGRIGWKKAGRLESEMSFIKGKQEPVAQVIEDDFFKDGVFRMIKDLSEIPVGSFLYLHPASIPKGWQLVPIEPTDEMAEAWRNGEGFNGRYKAMIAAAPKPKMEYTEEMSRQIWLQNDEPK